MLTGKQRSFLKKLAHRLEPTVFLGKGGLTENIKKELVTGFESRELVKVKLYFANAAGDKLIASYREKHYSTNTPLERFVVEELIAGPSGQIEGLYPVINPETKIVNILTKDGICYVNLDSNFLTVINNVSTEVAVYSIVNSLVELDNINKVQILVNGEVPPTFSNSTFERNLDYVTTLEQ